MDYKTTSVGPSYLTNHHSTIRWILHLRDKHLITNATYWLWFDQLTIGVLTPRCFDKTIKSFPEEFTKWSAIYRLKGNSL